jgi:hypothetical protein
MGQYLKMGICNRIVVNKNEVAKHRLSLDTLIESLNCEMDMSLFEMGETEEEYIFTIKESIVSDQLLDFISFQYSLYNQEDPYRKSFDTALQLISEFSTIKEIDGLARKKSLPCFQFSKIDHEIKVKGWDWLRTEVSIWLLFAEGKIIMESYSNFLRFMDRQIREASKNLSISRTFRCFID